MTEFSLPPDHACLAHRSARNAHRRRVYAQTLPLDSGVIGFLVTLTVSAATAIYVSLNVERARREEFFTAHALDHANRELAERSELLVQANARLEAGHRDLASRSEELARLNAELAARSSSR